MDPDSRIYLSFQSNVICDVTQAESSFENEFNKMKNELNQNGIHIANLSANLRNTKTIGDLSRNVKSFTSMNVNSKLTQHIQPLAVKPSEVKSLISPFMIPIYIIDYRLKDIT